MACQKVWCGKGEGEKGLGGQNGVGITVKDFHEFQYFREQEGGKIT